MTKSIRPGAYAFGAAALMLVAGCSFSVGTSGPKTVAKADVANQISDKVNEKAGHKPESVSCPEDLKAAVGTSIDCQMTDGGQTYGVNVTVTSVDGDRVNFDIIETVNKDDVAKSISDQLTQQFGRAPESVSCPDNLKGDVGATPP